MLGYANVMKFLTINDENRLRIEVDKLSAEEKIGIRESNKFVVKRKR